MAQVTPSDYVVGLMANAIEQQAMRPQKETVRTFTTSTSTPRALEDMIMRRNSIGANNQRLLDALKGRETWNYNLGAGLANLAPVQGYGDWGVNALRAFGGAMNRPTDAQIAREQAAQELAQKDLETALAYDKEMGETENQNQTQNIGYTTGTGQGDVPQSQVPIISPKYWEEMIANFDESRPTEGSYRNQTQLQRNLENKMTFAGSKDEAYARDVLYSGIKGKKFMPMVRSALKGGGQISDYEDKKYSQWLENAPQDPVGLKDVAVMIVKDYSANHGLNPTQENNILESLGLTSMSTELLPQQIKHEPERVKTEETSIDVILKKHGAKRVD